MLSPQLRSKVHNLWTMFWAAGMTNPLVAVEQITYLLFLRQLESLDARRVALGKPTIYYKETTTDGKQADYSKCKWSYITKDVSFGLLNDTVFPWLRGLEKWLATQPGDDQDQLRKVTGRLDDAYFVLDPNKATILTEAITQIDELFRQSDTQSRNADIMGDIFEHLLGEIQSSGKNGQFRTPRQVIRFMIEVLDPAIGSKVLDPACGTGGFAARTETCPDLVCALDTRSAPPCSPTERQCGRTGSAALRKARSSPNRQGAPVGKSPVSAEQRRSGLLFLILVKERD